MAKSERKKTLKTPVKPISKEVKKIIRQLKSSKISCFDVPEEYQSDKNVIDVERELNVRRLSKRGYDIIRNSFFVEEELDDNIYTQKITTYFDDFESYSTFVDDKIYDNACYYQYDFSKINISVDFEKLNERKSFVDETIDDYTAAPTEEEIRFYNKGEQIKKQCKRWIDKFNSCATIDEFREVQQNYWKSDLPNELKSDDLFSRRNRQYRTFFMWQYIFSALNDKKRFDILMEYMSDYTCASCLVREVCTVFNPDDVMAAYNFENDSKSSTYNQKKRLKDIAAAVKNGLIDKEVFAFFDEVSHYYCEECTYRLQEEKTCRNEGMSGFCTYRYFETFEEFIKYRNGDLSNCDLTKAFELDYDFTKCRVDDTTKLPLRNTDNLKYVVKKEYSDNKFKVLQVWYNSKDVPVKYYSHNFEYFCDFVAFLKKDLSDANLLFCDGLQNLNDISGMNLKNAIVTSIIRDKFGMSYPYELYKVNKEMLKSFSIIEENEKNTELELQTSRELDMLNGYDMTKERVYYVSDIHLLHKLGAFEPKAKEDVAYIIQSIVDDIVRESGSIILIGGDVSSDFSIFEVFIKFLRNEFVRRRYHPLVIFVLGNHELWEFPQNSFDEIVAKYRELINECGMYLLQNNVICRDSKGIVHEITAEEILSLDDKDLREKIRTSRITLFGGLGFSGHNERFNANFGIYRDTIDRTTEIEESKKFEKLYAKICSIYSDKNLVVFTHMPMDCWCKDVEYHKNFIYVSGHTHKNYFYDDGEIRIYADNQIGYKNNKIHMKWFDTENEYDYFADYQDGIYEITADEYREFYRGKNIRLNFNREVYTLYMLKKRGYYCFIHESECSSMTILNGGERKKLHWASIDYYYENMDSVVARIKQPLDTYTNFQKTIATEIQKIGGSGNIHGCIIDIDWFNHVYVNPIDMKITGYWASDIIDKKIYPTVPALLKKECPVLYARYEKLLEKDSTGLSVLGENESNELDLLPQSYFNTDIYKASREIKKMQKLGSNILTTWHYVDSTNKMIE